MITGQSDTLPTIGVYIIINPTGKYYIGKSINIERRIKQYSKADCKPQPKLYRSIIKYGWDAHEHVVAIKCDEEELDMYEKYLIEWHKTIEYGMNCMKGGNGCRRPTDEQRERMSESKKGLMVGAKNPMYGKKWSQERKDARHKWLMENVESIREKARISGIGRVFSKESREKKSKSLMGHPVSESVREALRKYRSLPVLQFDLSGNFIKEFPSAKSARLETKSHNVSECAAGKLKTSGGFIWKYKKDISNELLTKF